MKKLLFTLFLACSFFLINSGFSQSFNIDLRNFEQVNETEFTFEAYIQNESGIPYTLFAYQFEIAFDAGITNGGVFIDTDLTCEGESELTGINKPLTEFFGPVGLGSIRISSDIYLSGVVAATYLDDATEYKIDKFRVKLSKDGSPHHFADMAPAWKFNLSEILVYKADKLASNTMINGPDASMVTRNKPATALDHNLGDRQMAGYFYTSDGGWNEAGNWNNVTVVNKNTLPGANSNAIINGNVTIPNGLDVSLLPNVNGNGGELTVLTGAEPLYTLTVQKNGNSFVTVTIYAADQSTDLGTTVQLAAGTEVYLSTGKTGPPQTFNGWHYLGDVPPPYISNLEWFGPYVMPAANTTVIAHWSSGTKDASFASDGATDALYASLNIIPGASLTVDKLYNDNTNGAAAILVRSDVNGTGYLIHNNAGVLATVERFLAKTFYHYLSTPISDAEYSLFRVYPQPVLPAYADFWQWNEVLNQWENLNVDGNENSILEPARGYAVAYSDEDKTKSFVGTLNTGDYSFVATYTNTWMQRGFNFIGNPYASAIEANDFITENTLYFEDIGGGLYFWDETTDYDGERWDYATYTKVGGTSSGGAGHTPTGIIAPSQGFMVNVNQAGDLLFNNGMRTTDTAYFFKEDETITRSWLSVTGPEGDYNEILTGFLDEGQFGIDITDAVKLKGNDKLAFYTLLEGKDYVIQGLPTFDPSKSYAFPLGLDAGITGTYTFKLREIENFDPQVRFILEDKLTGVFFDLNASTQYVAQVAAIGEIKDRFVFHINGVTAVPEIDQKLAKVYAANNQIFISLTGNNKILDVEVFNTLGQTILRTPVNATETTLNLQGSNVVYIVKVTTSQGVESHKILLR